MILKNCRLLAPLSDGKSSRERRRIHCTGKDSSGFYENGEAAEGTDGEEIVDCGGKTLLPGLIDAHTHIAGLCGYHPGKVKIPYPFSWRRARKPENIWTADLPPSETAERLCGWPTT